MINRRCYTTLERRPARRSAILSYCCQRSIVCALSWQQQIFALEVASANLFGWGTRRLVSSAHAFLIYPENGFAPSLRHVRRETQGHSTLTHPPLTVGTRLWQILLVVTSLRSKTKHHRTNTHDVCLQRCAAAGSCFQTKRSAVTDVRCNLFSSPHGSEQTHAAQVVHRKLAIIFPTWQTPTNNSNSLWRRETHTADATRPSSKRGRPC